MHKHKKKLNRHEILNQIFLTGKCISPIEIRAHLKKNEMEHLYYRLSTMVYNIRKDDGIIRVYKEGKNVTAYQLVNFKEFNSDGRYIGEVDIRGKNYERSVPSLV